MYLSSLQSVLQVSSSRTLLDVGCSSGELLDLAHNFGFDKTIGVDLSLIIFCYLETLLLLESFVMLNPYL